jgi:polyisoprenoid-binding protein YceI
MFKEIRFGLFVALSLIAAGGQTVRAAEPEDFYNAPENINTDPNYVPGDYALPEVHGARTVYQAKRNELAGAHALLETNTLVTLNAGQITFSALKNETAEVLGYFRSFFGVLTLEGGEPSRMDMVIDINSLDTAVPGRNNRILDLFFQSANPELGTAAVYFDKFDLGGKVFSDMQDGTEYVILASGKLTLNQVEKEVRAHLGVTKSGSGWVVKTLEPLDVFIRDFALAERVPVLMKACNHKALGNRVKINVELMLK